MIYINKTYEKKDIFNLEENNYNVVHLYVFCVSREKFLHLICGLFDLHSFAAVLQYY